MVVVPLAPETMDTVDGLAAMANSFGVGGALTSRSTVPGKSCDTVPLLPVMVR